MIYLISFNCGDDEMRAIPGNLVDTSDLKINVTGLSNDPAFDQSVISSMDK